MNKRVLSIALSALFFAAPAWAMNEELEKTVPASYCLRYKLMGSEDNHAYLEETCCPKKLRENNNDNTDTSSLEELFGTSPTEQLMQIAAQKRDQNSNE